MADELIMTAVKSGIFAILFVFLLFYVLKDSEKREIKYQHLIDELTGKLEIVYRIDSGVAEIRDIVSETVQQEE